MMKLILSITLIWTLSSTAEALLCWHGQGVDIKQNNLRSCDSAQLCATVALQVNEIGNFTQSTTRLCLPPSLFSEGNHTFSFNVGFEAISASLHVCNKDGCNNQTIPYPDRLNRSNLMCFSCNDRSSDVCDKRLWCAGTEDRCINGTGADKEGKTYDALGCMSANICEVDSSHLKLLPAPIPVKFPHAPKCCEGRFCNSAWSVKLNVIHLLFGLFTLIIH